ncbi:iolC protein [Streptomyces laurentii]|uniref:IolC protein n=1 Tax=Streptomyces laurentii TaxID=39478 RepID=A0A160NYY8_STRLU|nr:iolC protein [Streptomyces laurentii]
MASKPYEQSYAAPNDGPRPAYDRPETGPGTGPGTGPEVESETVPRDRPTDGPADGPIDGPYDLITMGRLGVDLYPLRGGVTLDRVETFGRFLGGSPANVAVAAARLGRTTALVSRTGADPFGTYLRRELCGFGVDPRWVTEVPEQSTPLTFCEIFPPDHFPIHFYRRPKAPDLEIRPHELDLPALGAARAFWMTGTGLSAEPSRTATLTALRSRAERAPAAGEDAFTVFDLDWRPALWDGDTPADQARPLYREALRYATVAVGNAEECAVATGEHEPHAAARALLATGVRLAVVKQGPKGVLVLAADGTFAEVPPLPVDVVNGLGAGDAFGGALVHGLLAGWDLERTLRYAGAAGAIVAGRLACSTAMPYDAEIARALADGTGSIPEPPDPGDPERAPDPAPEITRNPGRPR